MGKDVSTALLEGARLVHDLVGSTMGPGGRLVVIDDPNSNMPRVSKDGATVADNIILQDKKQRNGAAMVVGAAVKQVVESGDGTTLTCILSWKILHECLKAQAFGINVNDIVNGLTYWKEQAAKEITKQSLAATDDRIRSVATIATNGDKEISKLIYEAFKVIGKAGKIDLRVGMGTEDTMLLSDGYEWGNGTNVSSYYTDQTHPIVVLKNPHFVIIDDFFMHQNELHPFFEKYMSKYPDFESRPPLVFVCPSLKFGDVRPMFCRNAERAIKKLPLDHGQFYFHVMDVQPEHSIGTEAYRLFMEDIAAITGGKYISKNTGIKISNLDLSCLGTAQGFFSTMKKSSIYFDSKGNDAIKNRVKLLNKTLETLKNETDAQYSRELIDLSIAKLTSKVATIIIGGKNEAEAKERCDRADDARRSVFCAKQAGVVPGGGVAMLLAARSIKRQKDNTFPELKSTMVEILKYPAEKIMTNKYVDNWKAIINQIVDKKEKAYDIFSGEIKKKKTMDDLSVVDPVSVILGALNNAFSVASLLFKVDGMIIGGEKPIESD